MCTLVTGVQTCARPIFRSSVVENFLTGGDMDGGEAYLEAYADQITAGDEVRIRSALKGPLEQRQAASDFVLATGGAEAGAGADTPLVGMFAASRSNESGGKQFAKDGKPRSEEHTSELQSLMRISYAVFRLKKKKKSH